MMESLKSFSYATKNRLRLTLTFHGVSFLLDLTQYAAWPCQKVSQKQSPHITFAFF